MAGWQNTRASYGFGDSNNNAVEEKKKQSWQDALQAASLAALAKGADTQTMAGYALGKWLSNYLARGAEKSQTEKDRRIANDQTMANNIGAMGQQSTNDIVNQLAHPSSASNVADVAEAVAEAASDPKYDFKLAPVTGLLSGSNSSGPTLDTGNWADKVNVLDYFKPKY